MPLVGRLEGALVLLDLPAAAAQRLLAPGLELAPEPAAERGRHPVILLCGEQRDVGSRHLPRLPPYREAVLAVPGVRPQGGPAGPFCHPPLLLLDRRLPTLLGRWVYGFAKRGAVIARSPFGFELADDADRAPLLSARLAAGRGSFERWGELLAQPLILRRGWRGWRCLRCDFALERAELRPLTAAVTSHRALLPGLPTGELKVTAACALATGWTLSVLSAARSRRGPRTGPS